MPTTINLVFRTIGERTTDLALELAIKHIRPQSFYLLENRAPFWEAAQESLTFNFQGDFVIFMDADCLILEDMRPFLDTNPHLHIDACLLDIFRGWVPAGVHITRLDLVQAMRTIPIDSGEPGYYLKPESWVRWRALKKMNEFEGLKRFKILHDFEHDYAHLFVKYITRDLRSRKSHKRIALDRKMQTWDLQDPDCRVVKKAIDYARRNFYPPSNQELLQILPTLPDIARVELKDLDISPKPALDRAFITELSAVPSILSQLQAKPMKLFGLGLSPNTLNLVAKALEGLGFHVSQNAGPGGAGANCLKLDAVQLVLIEDLTTVLGIGLAPFYPELDSAFPESQFILAVNERDEWLAELKVIQRCPGSRLARTLAHILGIPSLDHSVSSGWITRAGEALYQAIEAFFYDQTGKFIRLNLQQGATWEDLCIPLEHLLSPPANPHKGIPIKSRPC